MYASVFVHSPTPNPLSTKFLPDESTMFCPLTLSPDQLWALAREHVIEAMAKRWIRENRRENFLCVSIVVIPNLQLPPSLANAFPAGQRTFQLALELSTPGCNARC